MATSQPNLPEEISEESLFCRICREPYDNNTRVALLLPCLHNCCRQCLETKRKGRNFPCPVCRRDVKLGRRGVASFPVDIVTMKAVEFVSMKKTASSVDCVDCPDNTKATFRCRECEEYLCDECKDAHKRVVFSRHHTVMALRDLTPSSSEFFARSETCPVHPDQKLDLYCAGENCRKAVCTKCVMVSHKEKDGHDIRDLREVYEQQKEEQEELCEKLRDRQKQLEIDLRKGQKDQEELEESEVLLQQEITDMFDELVVAINNRRQELLNSVEQMTREETSTIDRHIESLSSESMQVQEAIDFLHEDATRASAAEFVCFVVMLVMIMGWRSSNT